MARVSPRRASSTNEESQDLSLESLHARTESPKAWSFPVVQGLVLSSELCSIRRRDSPHFCVHCCVLAPLLFSSPLLSRHSVFVRHLSKEAFGGLLRIQVVCLPCLQGCCQSEGSFGSTTKNPRLTYTPSSPLVLCPCHYPILRLAVSIM